jgi:general secretion pathway protein B
MSILLDALRKSEEQRRLGATPTLQTPESAIDLKLNGQRNWIPALMMALAAIVIAWIGAVQFHRPPPAVVPALAATESQSTDVPIQVETTPEAVEKSATKPDVPPAGTPVMDFTAEPQAAEVPAVAAETGQTVMAGRADPNAVAPVAQPIAALAEDLSSSDVAARPGPDQLEPYAAEPISYWQIPQSLRESMPEMRITVLVYSENPQDRFLLINGKRVREKDEVSDGLVVEEIQRDRAIFTYRDYRFQLKS